jgi:hypothetical protein
MMLSFTATCHLAEETAAEVAAWAAELHELQKAQVRRYLAQPGTPADAVCYFDAGGVFRHMSGAGTVGVALPRGWTCLPAAEFVA